jgi:polysaccharide pyruvyl transferase WcaK-like protein
MLKDGLFFFILNMYAGALRIIRQFRFSHRKDSSVLLLPPAGEGSLGDEAMIAASIKLLNDRGVKRIGLITYGCNYSWGWIESGIEIINLLNYLYWGSWKDKFLFITVISRYTHFYCLGADTLDGFYQENRSILKINLVALAAKAGAQASIVNFSFNEEPKPACVRALNNLPVNIRLCCRDPLTYKRLISYIQHPMILTSDIAFLLNPDYGSVKVANAVKWIQNQKEMKHKVIGVNVNMIPFLQLQNIKAEDIIKAYSDILEKLFNKEKRISYVFIPHDFRSNKEGVGDILLAKRIIEELPRFIKDCSIILPTPYSAAEVKAICKSLDFAFTGRLHLAIACLGQGIPVITVSYQGKAVGTYQHFGIEDLVVEPIMIMQTERMINYLLSVIEKRKSIQNNLEDKILDIKRLAELNFANLS